jgi:DNA adenine methylase
MRLPHPIPYQGSKRRLAPAILAPVQGHRFERVLEPFAGSAAITIAACGAGLGSRYVIGDSLESLVELWRGILDRPDAIADGYEWVWAGQLGAGRAHYSRVREEFNRDGDPVKLLYLLARCVKNSPRFNACGAFNQSADHRRRGLHPRRMRAEIESASALLAGVTTATSGDFEDLVATATARDLVYLDPPWEGTSAGPDKRYHESLARRRLIAALDDLNRRGVPWLLSYDGRHGDKRYGLPLPDELGAVRLELVAGRSSQATLHGRNAITVESLYVSAALAAKPAGAVDLAA